MGWGVLLNLLPHFQRLELTKQERQCIKGRRSMRCWNLRTFGCYGLCRTWKIPNDINFSHLDHDTSTTFLLVWWPKPTVGLDWKLDVCRGWCRKVEIISCIHLQNREFWETAGRGGKNNSDLYKSYIKTPKRVTNCGTQARVMFK